MTVYLASIVDWKADIPDIEQLGVFSTEKKAKRAILKVLSRQYIENDDFDLSMSYEQLLKYRRDDWIIDTWEVDKEYDYFE